MADKRPADAGADAPKEPPQRTRLERAAGKLSVFNVAAYVLIALALIAGLFRHHH